MPHPLAGSYGASPGRPSLLAPLQRRLIGGGGTVACLALVLLFGLCRIGLSTRDTMTLLPAAVCLGLAAVGLGLLSLCVQELQRA